VETIKKAILTIEGKEYAIFLQRFLTTSGFGEGYKGINPVTIEINGEKYEVSLYLRKPALRK
jgi:hypothetical protein